MVNVFVFSDRFYGAAPFWFVSFMIIAKTCVVSGILNSLIIVIDLVISLFFKKK